MADQSLQIKDNIPDEIKAAVVQIPSSSKIQVQKPDLEDNQKRWLVVGICANSIVSPALRFYVEPIINNLYQTLKSSNNIHSQTYSNYMKKYPSTNQYNLNYEAINNNASLPKVRGKPNFANFNYNVQNTVDFSKLFLQTHMVKYTGFDDSCDASALLGLLINIDIFPANVKTVATKVRADIRNPWAHCNFLEWDNIKYLNAFQQMHQLNWLRILVLHNMMRTDFSANCPNGRLTVNVISLVHVLGVLPAIVIDENLKTVQNNYGVRIFNKENNIIADNTPWCINVDSHYNIITMFFNLCIIILLS